MLSTPAERITRPAAEARPRGRRMVEKKPLKTLRHARGREIAVAVPVAQADRAAGGAAEFDGGGNQGVEYRLQIERRAADDLEPLGGGGLLLQGFAQIMGPRLHLLEQPYI